MIKKISREKLKKLIKEEKESAKMYKEYGFDKLAKDESKHSKFLRKKLKK